MSNVFLGMLASATALELKDIPIDCVPQRHWFNTEDSVMKTVKGEIDTGIDFLTARCKSGSDTVDYCDLEEFQKLVKCPDGTSDCWLDLGPDKCKMKPEAAFNCMSQEVANETYVEKINISLNMNADYTGVTMFGEPWIKPAVTLNRTSESHVEILFFDDGTDRWMIPEELYPRDEKASASTLDITYSCAGALDFAVRDTAKTPIITLIPQSVILEDAFIQVGFKLNSKYITGVGEHMRQEIYRPRTVGTKRYLPCFTRPVGVNDGNDFRSENLYGCHPVFTMQSNTGTEAVVVFAENSNAQEFELWAENEESEETVLTWRAIGGVPRFHIFSGETELEAISKYQAYVGKPFMPPYFAFGHQLSKYGYIGLEDIKTMHKRMDALGVPFDIQTFDIDYMRRRMDFSLDDRVDSDRNYADLPNYINELEDRNVKAIMMFDPAISAGDAMLANDSDSAYGAAVMTEVAAVTNYGGKRDGVFVGGLEKDIFVKARLDFTSDQFDALHLGYRPPHGEYDTSQGSHEEGWFDNTMTLKYTSANASSDLAAQEGNLKKTLYGKVWSYFPHVDPESTCDAWVGLAGPENKWTGKQVVSDSSATDTAWNMDWDFGVGACSAPSAFPDWMKKNTVDWWKHWINVWRETYKVGAYWIDMNEPENFSAGSIGNELVKGVPGYAGQCGDNVMNHPKFKPQMSNYWQPLYDKTLCMDARHTIEASEYGGSGDIEVDHYNFHSLYGYSQGRTTKKVLDEIHNERTFVFSRSTFAGAGAYMGHWTGDNTSAYDHMRASIPAMLDMNLFGIPFVGADICGFFNDTKKHLCYFWIQLGAFYPFSRNHNTIFTENQDAASFGEEFSMGVIPSMKMRYKLNPYLYNLFKSANEEGTLPVRSLYQNYPKIKDELRSYTDVNGYVADREFMYGDKVLFAFMVENLNDKDTGDVGAETIGDIKYDILLPNEDTWYNIWDGSYKQGGKFEHTTKYLDTNPPIFIKGDTILITKVAGTNNEDTRANSPFDASITIGDKMINEGLSVEETQFWDSGDDKEPVWSSLSLSAKLTCSELEVALSVTDEDKNFENDKQLFKGFTVYTPVGMITFDLEEALTLKNGLSEVFKYDIPGVVGQKPATGECPDPVETSVEPVEPTSSSVASVAVGALATVVNMLF